MLIHAPPLKGKLVNHFSVHCSLHKPPHANVLVKPHSISLLLILVELKLLSLHVRQNLRFDTIEQILATLCPKFELLGVILQFLLFTQASLVLLVVRIALKLTWLENSRACLRPALSSSPSNVHILSFLGFMSLNFSSIPG